MTERCRLLEHACGKDFLKLAFDLAAMRRSRWRWFLAALAGWTVAAVGWAGLWWATRIP